MKYTALTTTARTTEDSLLNMIYTNLLEYVSVLKQEGGNQKEHWATDFVAACESGDKDFAFVYKNLKQGLINQYGFEETNEVILPQIMWSNNLEAFCD